MAKTVFDIIFNGLLKFMFAFVFVIMKYTIVTEGQVYIFHGYENGIFIPYKSSNVYK